MLEGNMRSNMNSGYSQILYSACVILILLWQLQNVSSTIQACGTLSLDKPVLKSGVLTLEEHSILNMTFSFRNETCNTSSEIKFTVEARTDRERSIWAPLCEITMKSTLCRGSFHQNMTCTCLTNSTYMLIKKVDRSEPKYWKLSTHMTPSAVNFTLNVTGKSTPNYPPEYTSPSADETTVTYFTTSEEKKITEETIFISERTRMTSEERCSSIAIEGPSTEKYGPSTEKYGPSTEKYGPSTEKYGPSTERNTLSMTTAVQTVLTSNEKENQLISKVIYVLGAVIFIIICMAIVICVIVRKLHMKARYPQLQTPELRSYKYPQDRNEMTLSPDSQERQIGNLNEEDCNVNYQCSDSEVTLEMKIKVPISNRHHMTRRKSENQIDIEYLTPTSSNPPKRTLNDHDYQEICEESISFANSNAKTIMFR